MRTRKCLPLTVLIGTIVALVFRANGQTNTFPTSGNVGIGTTSPTTPLTVVYNGYPGILVTGNSSSATSVKIENDYYLSGNYWNLSNDSLGGFTLNHNGGDAFSIGRNGGVDANFEGSVGINKSSPRTPLDVGNATTFPADLIGLYDSGSSIQYGIGIDIASSQNGMVLYSGDRGFTFKTDSLTASGTQLLTILHDGNVGIGTTTPDQALAVNGTVHAKEVLADNSGWPDFVFTKGYHLVPLREVEKTINAEGHLPNMPTAKEVAAHGINVGGMQAKLLAQIEELTLHVIAQEKEIDDLKTKVGLLSSARTK